MKNKIRISVALIGFFIAQVGFACDEPADITVPNGNRATEADMTEAGRIYHQYMIDMQLYQVCLEDEADQERLRADDLSRSEVQVAENRYVRLHNSASTAMEKTTERFEKAIEAYEANN